MVTLILKGKKVKLYDSPNSLSLERYRDFQKCIMIHSGVGSSLAELDEKIKNVVTFISKDKKDFAIQELSNIRETYNYAMSGVNMSQLAFACLVHSIDGKIFDPVDGSDLEAMIAELSGLGLSQEEMSTTLFNLKKKLNKI